MDKLNCMKAFCHVVNTGSFSAGAKSLGVSKVLISRYVAKLEEDLGIRLLQRTTRKMSLTDEGQEYFIRCQAIIDDFIELERSTKDKYQGVHGRLKISVPSQDFTCSHLIPFISDFSNQYSDVKLDIHLTDHYIDIVEEGYDLAIRIGKLEDSSLIAKKLSTAQLTLCASPEYIANIKKIEHPQELVQHKLIIDTNYRGGNSWKFTHQKQTCVIQATEHIKLNSSMAVKSYLLTGSGIGICPSFCIEEELKSQQLIPLLPQWSLNTLGIYALYSHRKQLPPKTRIFINALSQYFEKENKHSTI